MKTPLTPFHFDPVYKSAIWGGNRLRTHFERTDSPEICSESWEISAHPDGMSRVSQGPHAGRTLQDLTLAYGPDLIGKQAVDVSRFPLLFKLIDASDQLSVQVHPSQELAPLTNGDPKTEMWVVMDCTPEACLYTGLTSSTTPDRLRQAVQDNSVAKHLVRLNPKPGQAIFIPGGLVHAIGKGCLIYEVQQQSNTTYRLFDWNRIGPDNQPRDLHLEEGFQSIDWSLPPPSLITPEPRTDRDNNTWAAMVSSPFFTVRQLELNAPLTLTPDCSSFIALFVVQGQITLTPTNATPLTLPHGTSFLIPASAAACILTPQQTALLLVTTLTSDTMLPHP